MPISRATEPTATSRACMVEVDGERVLAASCIRTPSPGMNVTTNSARASKAQRSVFEMLMADQPARAEAHEYDSQFWHWSQHLNLDQSRFPSREMPSGDASHPAMRVNLDACIQCNLCVRACREVQVNDVIGMAYRGSHAKIVFDMDDPMGDSTCVACGECVQACPTGALTETKRLDAMGIDKRQPLREVESVCPYCGVGCQITYQIEGNEVVSVKGADSNCCVRSTCARITVWPRAYAKASDAIQGDHGTIGSVSHQSGQRRVRC
jgi:formate dehydrogenase major subunit